MRKYFKSDSEAAQSTEMPELFEGQKEERAKVRKVLALAMIAAEKRWEEAKAARKTAEPRRQKTLAGRIARSLALLDFIKILNEETGASLSSEDLEVHGRERPVFCCAYCGEPIRRLQAARHVEECKRGYQILEQRDLLGIYRVSVRLPSGKFETVYPDLVEVKGGDARCVVCGQKVEGPKHFDNGGTVGCTALEDFLKRRDWVRSQWREALRNGRLVYVRNPFSEGGA